MGVTTDEPDQVRATAPALRADARQNRDRIIAAASDAFADRGLDISMAAIARRAGVGVATLFRRFPTKQALVHEVFDRQFQHCGELLDAALADPDPWRGFCVLLESVRRMQVSDRGFTEAFVAAVTPGTERDARVLFAEHGFTELIGRAQRAGRLRPDFDTGDLVVVLLAIGGMADGPADLAEPASKRLLGYLVDAFTARPGAGRRTLPPPVAIDFRSAVDVVTRQR